MLKADRVNENFSLIFLLGIGFFTLLKIKLSNGMADWGIYDSSDTTDSAIGAAVQADGMMSVILMSVFILYTIFLAVFEPHISKWIFHKANFVISSITKKNDKLKNKN